MAKTAKKKPFKITPATKRRSRGDTVNQIALGTELKPRQVKEVLGILTSLIAADLSKKGCGEFNFNGLMKLKTINKPATKARPGRNPFTGRKNITDQSETGEPQGPRPGASSPEWHDLNGNTWRRRGRLLDTLNGWTRRRGIVDCDLSPPSRRSPPAACRPQPFVYPLVSHSASARLTGDRIVLTAIEPDASGSSPSICLAMMYAAAAVGRGWSTPAQCAARSTDNPANLHSRPRDQRQHRNLQHCRRGDPRPCRPSSRVVASDPPMQSRAIGTAVSPRLSST